MEGKMGEWETKNGRDKKNTVTEGGGGRGGGNGAKLAKRGAISL